MMNNVMNNERGPFLVTHHFACIILHFFYGSVSLKTFLACSAR